MANRLKALLQAITPSILGGSLVSKQQTWQGGTNRVMNADFFSIGGKTLWEKPTQDNTAYYLQACPALTTIIGRKAQAFVNGRAEVLYLKDDNYVKGGANKAWYKLLKNPNPIQSDRQFRIAVYTFIQAYGFCPVRLLKPVGFENSPDKWQMWILPPQFLKITTNSKYLGTKNRMDMIDSIEFKYDGETTNIGLSNIYIFTGVSPELDNLTIPDSPLLPLKYPINNLIKIYEATGTLTENFGALGILSDNSSNNVGNMPLSPAESDRLQAELKRKFGLNKGQSQVIITTASLTYQNMAIPVRDLMLLESESAAVKTIADAFQYPSVLLSSGDGKGTTYSNQEGAERKLYQDTIVPEAENYQEQLNEMLGTEKFGVKICYDYEWLPVLQMDAKLRSQVRRELGLAVIYEFMNGVITWNEMKKALWQDTVEGMDLYVYQLPPEYRVIFENNKNQTNSTNGTGYQGDTNGQNPGVEGSTTANNG